MGVFISINMVFVLLICSSVVISCFTVVQVSFVLLRQLSGLFFARIY